MWILNCIFNKMAFYISLLYYNMNSVFKTSSGLLASDCFCWSKEGGWWFYQNAKKWKAGGGIGDLMLMRTFAYDYFKLTPSK